jgi:hypothetical protein
MMTDVLVTVVLMEVVIVIIFSPSLLAAVKTKRREKQDTEEVKEAKKSQKTGKNSSKLTSSDSLILGSATNGFDTDALDNNALQLLNNSLSENSNICLVPTGGIAGKSSMVGDTGEKLIEEAISITRKTMTEEAEESCAPTKNINQFEKSELFLEIEANIATAKAPWTGKLLSFQTTVEESNLSEVDSLPMDVAKELNEAYIDIRLANRIVWLSEVAGQISKEMEESYVTLCANIAEHLGRSRLRRI